MFLFGASNQLRCAFNLKCRGLSVIAETISKRQSLKQIRPSNELLIRLDKLQVYSIFQFVFVNVSLYIADWSN